MKNLFLKLRVVLYLLTPIFVLLFIGLVMYRQGLILKGERPVKTDWEKFQDEIKKVKKEKWQIKKGYPLSFYYREEAELEKVETDLFSVLPLVEKILSRRLNRHLDIYLLTSEKANRVLGKEKSYVYFNGESFALLSMDYFKEDIDLFASRLVFYSLSQSDGSYWLREGLARYLAYDVINKRAEAFLLNNNSKYFEWSQLEKVKDIFSLNEEKREVFCRQSASVVRFVFDEMGVEKLPLMIDSLAAGSSGRVTVSYLTGQSSTELENKWREKFFLNNKESPVGKRSNRGQELSRLVLNVYIITLLAGLLGSVLVYYVSYRWRS